MLPAVNKSDGGDNQIEQGGHLIKPGVRENIIPPVGQGRIIMFYLLE